MNLVKEQLSKLLAKENINIEHAPVETAMFNLETRTLTLPTWSEEVSNDLYDLLISHEVGHALFTPTDRAIEVFNDDHFPNIHFFLNVVEDARIERMIKDEYPGLKKNYHFGYKELLNKDFFSLKDKNIDSLPLIDRLNLNEKIGSFTLIKFSEKEKQFINQIRNTKTFEDVIYVAKKLYMYSKQEQIIRNKIEESENFDLEYSDEYLDTIADKVIEGLDSFEGKNAKSFSAGNNASSNNLLDELNKFLKENNITEEEFKDFIPESQTQENFQENLKRLSEITSQNKTVYTQFPSIKYKEHIVPVERVLKNISITIIDKSHLSKIRKNTKKSVEYLIKMFELKKSATFYVKNKINKTGTIDTSKLFSYKYNEDIFKKINTVPEGKSHGMIMLLDWSGSMNGTKVQECFAQIVATVTFCKKMNIPFSVFLFGCNFMEHANYVNRYSASQKFVDTINFKENDIYSHSLNYSLVEILNSDLNKNNFEYLLNAFATMVYTHDYRNFEMGGTPIIESCHIIDNYIPYFKEKHKIEICNFLVITDGIGNYIDNIYGNKSYGMKKISNYSRKYVRDTETKKLYKIDDNNDLLNIKLNIIRDKHKCNLIGFFVGSIQENQQIVDIYAQISERVDIKKSLKKNGCATIENVGYDEFHLVISQNVSNPKLVITKKDDKEFTTRTLTSAFTKFLKKKTLSKIVLSKFVERISKQVA